MENRLDTVRKHVDRRMAQKGSVIVAIDGQCTSGKTTLAQELAGVYNCNVFHMDDFFLRPEQRTEARYAQIGGNVDYERFREEVLLPLLAGKEFSYRPFNCKTLTLSDPVQVCPSKLNIIEGSYSMHPYFGDPYDLKILLTVDSHTQKQRVLSRPAFVHASFFERWIPMENQYLQTYHVAEAADLIL